MYNAKVISKKKIELAPSVTKLLGSFTFALLIAIGAFVYIPLPFTPVPITLQVMFVLLAGIMLGGAYGSLSVLIYVIVGIAGLPVFAGAAGGFARILGPTGGYIIGFLLAPFVVSSIERKLKQRTLLLYLAMFAGLFVIYAFGMLHLSIFLKNNILAAFRLGVLPFITGDIVKIIFAVFFIQSVRRRFGIS